MRLFTAAILAAFLLAPPASAQRAVPCAPRGEFVEHLRVNYGEVPVAMGIAGNGALIEVLAAPSGSWTYLLTAPGRLTCGFVSGAAWEVLTPPELPPAVRYRGSP